MTREEREAFLADLHVGVLSVAGEAGRPPNMMPMWYRYEPGGMVMFTTAHPTRKARLLEKSGRVSLCVQGEQIPYRYVTVEGQVANVNDPAPPDALRAIAPRYIGPERAAAMVAATKDWAPVMQLYHVQPERWHSADHGEEF